MNGAAPLTLIRVFDTETSALENGEVCEVGWTDVRLYGSTWQIDKAPQSRLCGISGFIEPEAKAEHHIDETELDGLPPFVDILPTLLQEVDYPAAHNAEFDSQFFPDKRLPWLCTMKCASALWPGLPSYKNNALRYRRGIPIANPDLAIPAHRAGPDSYVTAHILIELLATPNPNGETYSLSDFAKVSSLPRRIHRFNFGKHKGCLLVDVPADYLEWVVNKSDLDADIKWNCNRELLNRERQTREFARAPDLFSAAERPETSS